ncbi:GatB/YqeY domain-containing protein [Lacimicrobium alkaliphilum]|uniref:Glutamyl-tRNA amidotransferase n=1 Tax=Lacimicrobium alkaliphilum TaxID=1526571 RepID=A0A0U3B2N7_9ALTE|nr:GatB/YqeY domain-containing protein [Lacimicrobium alkaliphilum]ALS99496.1 glutamyl-tRNA amidotransferase [Lacimicrobium alkaliphilum]
MSLIDTLKDNQKQAMRDKDKLRLGTIRMALAEIKQREIDGRTELNESDVIAILTKMVKQRKDAQQQFEQAGRQDLAEKEAAEVVILQDFLPQPLSPAELDELIAQAMSETGAAGMQDMGKVMGWLKPKVQGRTDMGQLSGLIKSRLN